MNERKGVFAKSREREAEAESREAAFRLKTATQQFLRNYSPLIVAALRGGRTVAEALTSRDFSDDVKASRAIAASVCGAVSGKDPARVTPQEARVVRADAVALVAAHRERGIPCDAGRITATIVDALSLADADFDVETVNWREMSTRGSMSLTASHAAMALWTATSAYDFRLGQAAALSRCMETVTRLAQEAAATILGTTSTEEDRRSLMQSVLRDMAQMLGARYESVARRTVAAVLRLPKDKQDLHFLNERPFETMVEDFKVEARSYLKYAASTSDKLVATETAELALKGYSTN